MLLPATGRSPFRKPYPEIDVDYTRFKFPVLANKWSAPFAQGYFSQNVYVSLLARFQYRAVKTVALYRAYHGDVAR